MNLAGGAKMSIIKAGLKERFTFGLQAAFLWQ
jgi:hypothetical protein